MEKNKIELFKTTLYANYLKFDNEKQFKKKLNLIYRKDKGRIKTNVGGYQSNDLPTQEPVFTSFVNAITNEVNEYAKQYGFIQELKLTNFWLNVNNYKNYNSLHTHPASLFSGVYYIDIPKNSGLILFERLGKQVMDWAWNGCEYSKYNPVNSTSYALQPENNLLLIFPSWLPHKVDPNLNRKQKRTSISFNFC
jgi:uncharacterized protein (TIGR02466 family)